MKNQAQASPRKRTIRGGSTAQFPGKLHDMLCYVESHGLQSIISWNFDGRSFMIHDPEKLLTVLPLFFEQTKYRSFRRQLNMWHFERILDGPNRDSFHHPFFLRGNKQLCSYMSRDAKSLPVGTPLRKLSCTDQICILQNPQPLQSMLNTIYQARVAEAETASTVSLSEIRRVNSLNVVQGFPPSEGASSIICDQASFAGRNFFPLELSPKVPSLETSVPSRTLGDNRKCVLDNNTASLYSGSLERYLDNIMNMEIQNKQQVS